MAIAFQSRVSEVLQVDMHPAAQLGRGIMIDHATGVVIGETAVVGDNVSLLHQVTLGGSGTGRGKRHPTIGRSTLLSSPSIHPFVPRAMACTSSVLLSICKAPSLSTIRVFCCIP